ASRPTRRTEPPRTVTGRERAGCSAHRARGHGVLGDGWTGGLCWRPRRHRPAGEETPVDANQLDTLLNGVIIAGLAGIAVAMLMFVAAKVGHRSARGAGILAGV